jgi:hypothetical protein
VFQDIPDALSALILYVSTQCQRVVGSVDRIWHGLVDFSDDLKECLREFFVLIRRRIRRWKLYKAYLREVSKAHSPLSTMLFITAVLLAVFVLNVFNRYCGPTLIE